MVSTVVVDKLLRHALFTCAVPAPDHKLLMLLSLLMLLLRFYNCSLQELLKQFCSSFFSDKIHFL